MLLEVEGLEVRYDRNRAVRGVDLAVESQGIVAVLGANGAGKTSLLRAIQGMVRASRGAIRFDGQDITATDVPTRVRKGLVLVPEGRQIFVSLTVHENLLMGAYTRRDGGLPADLDAIYDRFPNLAERRDMRASVLSGGEQQMLAIGRALLARPRLMMLDEPSLGLSPLFVQRMFDLIGELNRDGLTILLVEQNTSMALEVAAEAVILELGAVALAGPVAEIAASEKLAGAYLGSAEGGDGRRAAPIAMGEGDE
ncbi:MAG TPA: ABC transporter ATP-binding protein [Hyphomicrobiales bacterium]|nr:ABC transporter ATP-binding protein [Hyphomicrobiales bacterium]